MGQILEGKGDVAILTGSFVAPGLVLRHKGFQSVVHEKFPSLCIVEVQGSELKPDLT